MKTLDIFHTWFVISIIVTKTIRTFTHLTFVSHNKNLQNP